jgi:carbonic anhydrase
MNTVEIIYRVQADAPTRSPPADADAARQRLDDGSQAFATLVGDLSSEHTTVRHVVQIDWHDFGLAVADGVAPVQRPFAAVLGCSDARVPIEWIFNEGPNDLFVVRVAGNGLGSEGLGSLKYAVEHLGASLRCILVLGHSGCGAVTAAVDVFLNPARYLALTRSHALREILDRLLIVVQASAKRLADVYGPDVVRQAGYREALIESAIVTNAALAAHTLQQEIGSDADIRSFFGVYLLDARSVWAPRSDTAIATGLTAPPSDAETFTAFAEAVMRSDRITTLLKA